MSWRKHSKVTRAAPKKQFFEPFCWTLWAPWRVFGFTLGSKLSQRACTDTVQAHREHSQSKTFPGASSKACRRRVRRVCGVEIKHHFGTPGRGFTTTKHTFSKKAVLQALKSNVTEVTMQGSCTSKCARDCGGSRGTLGPGFSTRRRSCLKLQTARRIS